MVSYFTLFRCTNMPYRLRLSICVPDIYVYGTHMYGPWLLTSAGNILKVSRHQMSVKQQAEDRSAWRLRKDKMSSDFLCPPWLSGNVHLRLLKCRHAAMPWPETGAAPCMHMIVHRLPASSQDLLHKLGVRAAENALLVFVFYCLPSVPKWQGVLDGRCAAMA